MESPSEDKLQKQFDAAMACLERICPRNERTRRAEVTTSTVQALADYRAYLSDLERAGDGAMGCGGLRGQLAERAFDAEGQMRVLLAEGLNSLNDIRDSGLLHASLALFAQGAESGQIDFRTAAEESVKQAQKSLDLPSGFTEEVLQILERRTITIRYERESETLVVRATGLDNEPEETRVRIAPRAGDLGRISLDHFFGDEGGFSVQAEQTRGRRGDCHSRAGRIERTQSLDAYAAYVGFLALGRETLYRHARKVSRYGHGSLLRARDPIDAAISVAIIAAIVLGVSIMAGTITAVTGIGPTFRLFGVTIPVALAIAVVAAIALVAVIIIFLL